jgi:hypothetical protein
VQLQLQQLTQSKPHVLQVRILLAHRWWHVGYIMVAGLWRVLNGHWQQGRVVGLLCLDSISGHFVPDGALLREIHSSWKACSYAGCC